MYLTNYQITSLARGFFRNNGSTQSFFIGSSYTKVYEVYNNNGNWEKTEFQYTVSSPYEKTYVSVGDIDGGGDDVYVISDVQDLDFDIYVYEFAGGFIRKTTIPLTGVDDAWLYYKHTFVCGNATNTGEALYFPSTDNKVYQVYYNGGWVVDQLPGSLHDRASAIAIGDSDNDGYNELIVGDGSGYIYQYDYYLGFWQNPTEIMNVGDVVVDIEIGAGGLSTDNCIFVLNQSGEIYKIDCANSWCSNTTFKGKIHTLSQGGIFEDLLIDGSILFVANEKGIFRVVEEASGQWVERWEREDDGYNNIIKGTNFIYGTDDKSSNHFYRFSYCTCNQLQVDSSPEKGIYIDINKSDIYERGSDQTYFSRFFCQGESISLDAPSTYGSSTFYKWQINGISFYNENVTVVMGENKDAIAYYDVELRDISAKKAKNNVRIEWIWIPNHSIVGFNIYRLNSMTGEVKKINNFLIPVKKNCYQSFLDESIEKYKQEIYFLETVEISGKKQTCRITIK